MSELEKPFPKKKLLKRQKIKVFEQKKQYREREIFDKQKITRLRMTPTFVPAGIRII